MARKRNLAQAGPKMIVPSGDAHATRRLIAFGDIHGCSHALDALLTAICPASDDCCVVLGDFIDQGWDTRDVIGRLIELQDACNLVCLQGNHEEMLLAAMTNDHARNYWINCGGIKTLNSYRYGATMDGIPRPHLDFIESCVDYYETAEFIFVHANFDPGTPMPKQPDHLLRWQLLDANDARCHESGKTVIVGHTEQTNGEVLDLGCIKCIDTACWRYGWLTALDVSTGQTWQASRFGQLRQREEPIVGPITPIRA
jgi:serine/threonine protein phosphatase 1